MMMMRMEAMTPTGVVILKAVLAVVMMKLNTPVSVNASWRSESIVYHENSPSKFCGNDLIGLLCCRQTDKDDDEKKEKKDRKKREEKDKKHRRVREDSSDGEGEWVSVKGGMAIPSVSIFKS